MTIVNCTATCGGGLLVEEQFVLSYNPEVPQVLEFCQTQVNLTRVTPCALTPCASPGPTAQPFLAFASVITGSPAAYSSTSLLGIANREAFAGNLANSINEVLWTKVFNITSDDDGGGGVLVPYEDDPGTVGQNPNSSQPPSSTPSAPPAAGGRRLALADEAPAWLRQLPVGHNSGVSGPSGMQPFNVTPGDIVLGEPTDVNATSGTFSLPWRVQLPASVLAALGNGSTRNGSSSLSAADIAAALNAVRDAIVQGCSEYS
jgi:hypothetical protein